MIPTLLLTSALAQEPDGPDAAETVIVYQPDGTPRVAGSAHVITEEELERYEYDDIGRVLAGTPGVFIRQEDGFGLRPNIGLRGANSDRSAKVTLLEDGVPLVPAPYAAPAAYYFPMPTRLVGVEVFKGPAATQHGPQTVGGAVNVLTRQVPRELVAQADFAYGMRNTAKLHGFVGTGGERSGVLGEVSHLQTDGFKRLESGAPTGFERTDALLKARWNTDLAARTHHALELKLGVGHERSNETYLGLHIDDQAEDPYLRYPASELDLMRWTRTQVELRHKWSAPGLRITTTAYHHGLSRQWLKLNRFRSGPSLHDLLQNPEGGASAVFLAILRGEEDTVDPGQALLIGTNDRSFQSFGVQSRLRWRVKGERVDSQLEAGIRIHGDRVTRLHTEGGFTSTKGLLERDDTPLATTLDAFSTATALAAHVHEDLEIGRLHLLPGARLEAVRTSFERFDVETDPSEPDVRATLLPGFAVLAEATDALQVFGGIHRGFSPVAPGQAVEVQPETSWNTEVGLRAGDASRRVEVVGFVSDYVNITGQCTISGGCIGAELDRQFNGGRARVFGVEGTAGYEWLLPRRLTLNGQASYALTESRFLTGFVSGFPQFGTVEIGDRFPYVPVHQGSLRLALDHPRFGVAIAGSGRSGMRDAAGQDPIDETGIPGQVLVDLSAQVRPDEHLAVYGTLINATNTRVLESWRPFGARPTAPLQLNVGVKLTR